MRSRMRLVAILAFIGLLSNPARAQLDAASQKLLIDKLDKVYLTLAPKDPSKVAVTMRLADLYADRARQESMNGGNPVADRNKALRLYNEILDRAPEAARPKVILQIGHLYQMNGQDDKAIALYQQNIGPSQDAGVRAEAHLSLGEIYFKRRDFSRAISHYDQVLESPKVGAKGLAAYRRAWARFNLGQNAQAIKDLEKILTTPELLSRSSAAGLQVDSQFKEEVSRDYATFLAKEPVAKTQVESLFKLSPEATRISNVQALAFDLERLGKKDDALTAWKFVSGYLSQPADRLAAHLSMAQLHLDKIDKPSALKSYEGAMQSWKETAFKNGEAEQEAKRRARNFLVAWNQTEKKNPSVELSSAYDLYLAVFPQDVDAQLYAAQIAQDQKNFKGSWLRYTAARDSLLKDKTPAAKDKLETVVLSLLELAESSKDDALAAQAYESYIEHSPKKTKLTEVQYQQARALYEKGDYPAASQKMRTIALGNGDPNLRKQAADLSLDALVLMKDETQLLEWSKDYQKAFPASKNDFAQISQKTLLTKSAAIAEKDPAAALALLKDFDPAQASTEDKVKFYKNKLILAERQGDVREAAGAADALLALPQTSKEDRELAWGRKAYFAELRLDFSTAFAATEKLEKSLPIDEKNFKLAVFAELSGRQSSPFYMSYLSQTKDAERKRLVAAELVRKSKKPDQELEAVKSVLAADPVLYAQISAEVYAKTGKEPILKRVTQDPKLRETDAGKLLARQLFLRDFEDVKRPLTADKLDTKSNNKLAASIKRRAALLNKVEELTKRSIQSGDWTAQLVSIDLLARESERFYQDLLSAPVPPGLSPEEEQEYLGLLSAQATPFQTKSSEAKAKVGQFWEADWSTALNTSWQQKPLRKLIRTEIEALKEIAPEGQRAKLDGYKEELTLVERPSLKDMQAARQRVFENPMDRSIV
ncbi:MAG TPA: tetratricopeptide repeat protein [Bdellovibrionales bacterium]|nr:tetratricopeptide repeat protein [Bdellovibrionales bacterium]